MNRRPSVQLIHPTGNANVRQILQLLKERQALAGLATSIYWPQDQYWQQLIPASLREQLARRRFDVESTKVMTNSFPEFTRLLATRMQWKTLQKRYSVDAIYHSLDKKVAKYLEHNNPDTVYCYEDGAEATFLRAKELNIRCVYDLPIAFWKTSFALMDEESIRYPQWAQTMSGRECSAEKLARKDHEIELADHVICPSQFVYDSLPETIKRSKPCTIARFGCFTGSTYRSRRTPKQSPLRVLFAGSLTQRKGLADVFQAFRQLNRSDIELVVLGSLCAPLEFYKNEYAQFRYETPRPHSEVLKLMSECDIFILPSLVEGRALVQLEALSVGLPLIITPNTGGEDLVKKDNTTGFMVPIRDADAIENRLNWFADNRSSIDEMKAACIQHATTINWETYRQTVADAVIPESSTTTTQNL